jgi:hypothetical protein
MLTLDTNLIINTNLGAGGGDIKKIRYFQDLVDGVSRNLGSRHLATVMYKSNQLAVPIIVT